MSPLIKLSDWEVIREQFTQDEKDALNLAVTGDCICPRGVFIDHEKLPKKLVAKLVSLLPQRRSAGG
jgi:hypothetical protein